MKNIMRLLLMGLLLVWPLESYSASQAYATPLGPNQGSVTLPVVADSVIENENGAGIDSNYGAGVNIITGGRWSHTRWRGLLKFDLSTVPVGVTIDAVYLHIFLGAQQIDPGLNNVISVYEATTGWIEEEVTWNLAKTSVPWLIPGGDRGAFSLGQKSFSNSDTVNQSYGITLDSSYMQSILDGVKQNHGIMLIGTEIGGETEKYFSIIHSKENLSGYGATLEVIYTLPVILETVKGLVAESYYPGQVSLCWHESSVPVSGYKVYRCLGYGCIPDIEIGLVEGNSYLDSGLLCGKQYGYTIVSYDSSGNESQKENFISVTTKKCLR